MANPGVSGGDKLSRHLSELAAKYSGNEHLRAGFLEGATYPDGEPVAMVAASNEFGRPENNQPARPFFRQAIEGRRDAWSLGLANLIAQGMDPGQALATTGEVVKTDIQDSIRALTSPPLSRVTIARKGFPKPLIKDAIMLNAVDYEVADGSEE